MPGILRSHQHVPGAPHVSAPLWVVQQPNARSCQCIHVTDRRENSGHLVRDAVGRATGTRRHDRAFVHLRLHDDVWHTLLGARVKQQRSGAEQNVHVPAPTEKRDSFPYAMDGDAINDPIVHRPNTGNEGAHGGNGAMDLGAGINERKRVLLLRQPEDTENERRCHRYAQFLSQSRYLGFARSWRVGFIYAIWHKAHARRRNADPTRIIFVCIAAIAENSTLGDADSA